MTVLRRKVSRCRPRSRAAATVAALVVSGAAAGDGVAESLVFSRAGNVWLANVDGSGQFQVTLDGTPGSPYTEPSQADDGTIVAQRGGMLYRMRQNGELLNPPVDTDAIGDDVVRPRVSPDGAKVGYSFRRLVAGTQVQSVTSYTFADRYTPLGDLGLQTDFRFSSWVTNARVLGHFANATGFDDPGAGRTWRTWFVDSDAPTSPVSMSHYDAELSPRGDMLAVVRSAGLPARDGGVLSLYRVTGGIVARLSPGWSPPVWLCDFGASGGGLAPFVRPTWSTDGRSIYVGESDGIHRIVLGTPCASTPDSTLVVAGGEFPDVGPAPVAPPPRGVVVPPPGGPAPPPDVVAPPSVGTPVAATGVLRPLAKLRARADVNVVRLSWSRLHVGGARVVVVRRYGRRPARPGDGTRIYNGRARAVTDAPFSRRPVFYAAFVVARDGRVSAPVSTRLARFLPALRAPLHRTSTRQRRIRFVWRRVARATYYDVEVWTVARPRRTVTRRTTATTVSITVRPGLYGWRVRPGRGAPSADRQGASIGTASFRVRR